jgi:hypothetical protein
MRSRERVDSKRGRYLFEEQHGLKISASVYGSMLNGIENTLTELEIDKREPFIGDFDYAAPLSRWEKNCNKDLNVF